MLKSAEARKKAALDLVRGWGGGFPDVVRATNMEDISQSRLGDR